MIHISGRTYELIYEHKNAWNPESFRERYSDVLERYDYVIGDWGYSQLRLKGFFRDNHPKATRDSMFSSIVDYINEYCNFGCAYFVLQKHPDMKRQEDGAAGREDEEYGAQEQPEGGEEGEAASLTAASEEGQEQPARIMPRHQRDPRRERHHRNKDKDRDNKDNVKDLDKEQQREGRNKTYAKDRDRDKRDRGGSVQGAGGGNNQERPRRSNDRERPNRRNFPAPKAAPVAAAAEKPVQNHSKE